MAVDACRPHAAVMAANGGWQLRRRLQPSEQPSLHSRSALGVEPATLCRVARARWRVPRGTWHVARNALRRRACSYVPAGSGLSPRLQASLQLRLCVAALPLRPRESAATSLRGGVSLSRFLASVQLHDLLGGAPPVASPLARASRRSWPPNSSCRPASSRPCPSGAPPSAGSANGLGSRPRPKQGRTPLGLERQGEGVGVRAGVFCFTLLIFFALPTRFPKQKSFFWGGPQSKYSFLPATSSGQALSRFAPP